MIKGGVNHVGYTLLNRFDNPTLAELIWVKKGDEIISKISDYGLTKDKKYIITWINMDDIGEIEIINDYGEKDYYTVKHFTAKLK